MPIYTIHHSHPLTPAQRDLLATRITQLHSTTFRAPSLFVNISFHDLSSTPTYTAGRLEPAPNHIRGHLRGGPSRSQKDYEELSVAIARAWEEVVGAGGGELGTVLLMPDIVAGVERGFLLPEAGRDGEWLRENWGEFRRRAGEGDEGMRELVREVEERGLLKGAGGQTAEEERETAMRKLEESLGWGDAA